MADAEPDDLALKKGTAELLVLAQLEGRRRHGYEIAQRIADALRGRRLVSGGVALSGSLSTGAARPHRRPVGGEGRPAPPPLLPADRRGAPGARGTAQELERLHARRATGRGARLCVTSRRSCAHTWRALGLPPEREQKIVEEWAAQLEEIYDGTARRWPLGRRGVARDPASGTGLERSLSEPAARLRARRVARRGPIAASHACARGDRSGCARD